jgi:hypothetical protein
MNINKYPIISKYFDEINDKPKFILDVMEIQNDTTNVNTIHITDYEVTTKITCHYLNHCIPMSRNSNTISIKSNYASYVYYLTIYILTGVNNYQYYTNGEFMIDSNKMYDLINELNHFVSFVCEEFVSTDSLYNLKETIKHLLLDENLEKIEDIYDEEFINSDQIVEDINKNTVKSLS